MKKKTISKIKNINIQTKKIDKISNVLILLSKIFFVGLVLQFLIQTFFTYKLNLPKNFEIIRLRKEILVIIMFFLLIVFIIKQKNYKNFLKKFNIKFFLGIFFLVIIFVIGLFFLKDKNGIKILFLSIKYNFFHFFIFIVFYGIFYFVKDSKKLFTRFIKYIKLLLIGGLFRRFIIWFLPKTLTFVGYDQFNYEGGVNKAPPVVYLTQYDEGYIRNQFLFERPIIWGFFLIAFRPFFFLFYLKNKKLGEILFRRGIYGLNVFSTFSRASRIARIFTTMFLLLFFDRKKILKLTLFLFLPTILGLIGITYFYKNQIINRKYSNLGHFKNIKKGVDMAKKNIIWGVGIGKVGPVSYQIKKFEDYNPENQFLQIYLEYGLFGFLMRLSLLGILFFKGIIFYYNYKKTGNKDQKKYSIIAIGFSLGLIGLGIEGLVLHSLVDRMLTYQFFALMGISYQFLEKKDLTLS